MKGPQQDFVNSQASLKEAEAHLDHLLNGQAKAEKEARLAAAQQSRQLMDALRITNQALGRENSAANAEQNNQRKKENVAIGQSNAKSHAIQAGAAATNAATSKAREGRMEKDDTPGSKTLGAQGKQAQIDATKARTVGQDQKNKSGGVKPPTAATAIKADQAIDKGIDRGDSFEQLADIAVKGGRLPGAYTVQRYRQLAEHLQSSDNREADEAKYRQAGIDPALLLKIYGE